MSSSEWPDAPIDGNLIWLAIRDGHLWKATTYQGQPGYLRRRGPEGEPDFMFTFADAVARFGPMEPWDEMVALDAAMARDVRAAGLRGAAALGSVVDAARSEESR